MSMDCESQIALDKMELLGVKRLMREKKKEPCRRAREDVKSDTMVCDDTFHSLLVDGLQHVPTHLTRILVA